MSIGTNIKQLREKRKLTQERVAEMVGVTFQAVSSWERDAYKPDFHHLIKLAELFDVSVSALVKCIDRCNNITTMAWGLSRERICRMIRETEAYYPALLAVIKAEPSFNNATWLLRYQIESMLEIYKRFL